MVVGVIGQKRMLFDLWGETVNLASRMESSGVPGHVHLADSTGRLRREAHTFEPREVEVKGFGPMRTFLLAD